MDGWWMWAAIIVLFALGVRLSAFFSGSEIGFYRISPLRLSIEADSGDRVAQWLLHFVHQPGYFVATTLVGNNVANYITTIAVTLATAAVFGASSGFLEILGTILVTPLIFVFGELIPKNLFYEAPHRLLRKNRPWFMLFYWLFLPFSIPLVWLCKLFERFTRQEQNSSKTLLGRKRLVQVLSEGHEEGLLTQVQNEFVQGLLHKAPQPVTDSMTKTVRVQGVHEDLSPAATLDFARQHGCPMVPVRHTESGSDWYGYVRVADIGLYDRPIRDITIPLLKIDVTAGKLQAILAMRTAGSEYAAVCENGTVLGLATEGDLVEEFFISQQTVSR
jgi:putative hemolysin